MGSSPLTRGRPDTAGDDSLDGGLIPAHAGSTARAYTEAFAHLGSSPLTRGRREEESAWSNQPRLIPAHAGSTERDPIERYGVRAHPRSRGVDLCAATTAKPADGSSPLTRGRRASKVAVAREGHGSSPLTRGRRSISAMHSAFHRLIPAHAGSTSPTRSPTTPTPAHPRSRGVDHDAGGCPGVGGGSSPLTRGRPPPRRHGGSRRGLIPAHAGSTWRVWSLMVSPGAHPRSRGVDKVPVVDMNVPMGSSPLTRGRLQGPLEFEGRARLIPAHAGSTHPPTATRTCSPAHPRSRGVDPWKTLELQASQ